MSEYNREFFKTLPTMWLCKTNRTKIHKLIDIYNLKLKEVHGGTYELSFEVSAYDEINHKIVKNPILDKFKGEYLIRFEWMNKVDYFVNIKETKLYSESGESVQYTFNSLGIQLNNYDVAIYNEDDDPRTLRTHLNDLLSETVWRVDHIDTVYEVNPNGDSIERSFSATESTVYSCVLELAKKFGALIQWDTLNEKVSFHDPEKMMKNKGMRFKEGIFLESFNVDVDFTKIITRLRVYGQDGLEFRNLSPTGSNYIESFDWYMYPFECDSNYNVIKSSKYLSDELCIAIKKYEKKLKDAEGQFKQLSESITSRIDSIETLKHELSILIGELNVIENELWVVNRTINDMLTQNDDDFVKGNESSFPQSVIDDYIAQRNLLIARRDAKKAEIDNKDLDIIVIEYQNEAITEQLRILKESLSVTNNFTQEQVKERLRHTRGRVHRNDIIIDEEDLLEEGLRVFKELSVPPVTVSLGVENFFADIAHESMTDRLSLGDTVLVQSKVLDVKISLMLIERTFDFENQTIQLTISNEKDLRDNFQKLLDNIYSASNTSTIVDMNKNKWTNDGKDAKDTITNLLQNEWDANTLAISAGYENLTKLDKYGLMSYEYNNSDTFLFINNSRLGITKDGGKTWELAISKNGVHANTIVGRLIMSNQLMIEDVDGVWETRGSTTTVFDRNGLDVMKLGLVNKGSNPECFGMVLDNRKHKISVTTCDGFKIERYTTSNQLEDLMYADLDGNFWVKNFTADVLNIYDSQNYFELEDNKIKIKDGTSDIILMGHIPYQQSFNGCTIQEDWGVLLKGTNNSNIFMTRNRGFAIDVGCQNKFHVKSNGDIYAQDIEANDLKIKSAIIGNSITLNENDGITINRNNTIVKLNDSDGIKINSHGVDILKIGTDGKLYLQNLVTMNDLNGNLIEDIDVNGSYISDLTVNKLKTLSNSNDTDYIHIEDTFMNFNTYYGGQIKTKFSLTFEGTGDSAYPKLTFGAGGTGGNNIGFIQKTASEMVHRYNDTQGYEKSLTFKNNQFISSIELKNEAGGFQVTTSEAIRFVINGDDITFTADGIRRNGQLVVEF